MFFKLALCLKEARKQEKNNDTICVEIIYI